MDEIGAKPSWILKKEILELREQVAELKIQIRDARAAVEVIQSSREILLNTVTRWAADYQQGKRALRELAELRARGEKGE